MWMTSRQFPDGVESVSASDKMKENAEEKM